MKAVFKREILSYFNNISGYVFGAFLLIFAGIYCMVYNLQGGYAEFEYVLSSMSFIFMVIVPVLTMRVLAEERRQKTDQLLYSLPISMTAVVLGKYAAMLVILLIPVAVIGIYPVILSAYGNVNLMGAFSAVTGFFFLGAALIAIGMYVSSVTESQAVAAGLCFVVMLINYFIASLAAFVPTSAYASFVAVMAAVLVAAFVIYLMTKNITIAIAAVVVLGGAVSVCYFFNSAAFESLVPNVLAKLSLFEQFYSQMTGIFDLRGIIYLISVTGVFLFLSVQSMEKRRWSE